MRWKNGLSVLSKILVIVGPTGVGKTRISIDCAQRFNGEIINADSRQVYKEMTIGTAKPSDDELNQVPHHLFNCIDLNEMWDASKSKKETDKTINEIFSRKKLPIIVGGTGLYIKSILFGLFEGPKANQEIRLEIENEIKEKGIWQIHKKLEKIDPEAANRIHPNDPTRIIRALEVYQLTGKTISELQQNHQFKKPRYDYLKVGLHINRNQLYEQINKRVDEMIEKGLENEVNFLFKKWGEDSLIKKSIGYSEWISYFKNEISLDEVVDKIKQNSRHFAKRQMTWFNKEKDIFWFNPHDEKAVIHKIETFLKG